MSNTHQDAFDVYVLVPRRNSSFVTSSHCFPPYHRSCLHPKHTHKKASLSLIEPSPAEYAYPHSGKLRRRPIMASPPGKVDAQKKVLVELCRSFQFSSLSPSPCSVPPTLASFPHLHLSHPSLINHKSSTRIRAPLPKMRERVRILRLLSPRGMEEDQLREHPQQQPVR